MSIPLPKLRSLFGRKNDTASFVQKFIAATDGDLYIEDADGKVVYGSPTPGTFQKAEIICEGLVAGTVTGGANASLVAEMLSLLLQKESEKKKLGSEVLTTYQELNVIFDFSEKLAQSIDPEIIAKTTLEQACHSIPSDSGVIVLWEGQSGQLLVPAEMGDELFVRDKLRSNAKLLLQMGLSGTSEIINDPSKLVEAGLVKEDVRSLVYAALKVKHRIMGAIILTSKEPDRYTAVNLKLLVTLALQSSTAIENALLYERNIKEVREREEAILKIHEVTMKFVPSAFIRSLGKEVITDVKLGDQIEKEVTVLFTDIRDFTTLSEGMSPEENFLFVSSFNGRMGPIIRSYNGFINQYLGDSIMAIFPDDPRDALLAAISMQQSLQEYNHMRQGQGLPLIKIGIGMHTGPLIMGITGDEQRMDAATISDTVNTAARIEGLTKYFRTSILLSENTMARIQGEEDFHLRYLGRVQLKGKNRAIGIHECFSGYEFNLVSSRIESLPVFRKGLQAYLEGDFAEAVGTFQSILEKDPYDQTTLYYLEHAKKYITQGLPPNWSGALEMSMK